MNGAYSNKYWLSPYKMSILLVSCISYQNLTTQCSKGWIVKLRDGDQIYDNHN